MIDNHLRFYIEYWIIIKTKWKNCYIANSYVSNSNYIFSKRSIDSRDNNRSRT